MEKLKPPEMTTGVGTVISRANGPGRSGTAPSVVGQTSGFVSAGVGGSGGPTGFDEIPPSRAVVVHGNPAHAIIFIPTSRTDRQVTKEKGIMRYGAPTGGGSLSWLHRQPIQGVGLSELRIPPTGLPWLYELKVGRRPPGTQSEIGC
jgi:hypothetical protein